MKSFAANLHLLRFFIASFGICLSVFCMSPSGSMHSRISPQNTDTSGISCRSMPRGLNTSIGCLSFLSCFLRKYKNVGFPYFFSLGENDKTAMSDAEPNSLSNLSLILSISFPAFAFSDFNF